MALVNTLTEKGKDLLDQVERVEHALGECPMDRMNEVVTALAACVKDMILHGQPLWEKREE
jgi:hypothetical protein